MLLQQINAMRQSAFGLLMAFFFLLCPAVPSLAAPDYVEEYYPVVNQAELHIIAKDYSTALANYQQAFEAVPSAFARDIYNAAICALLLQNEKQTYKYLEKLVEKGVSLNYLQRQPLLDSLAATKHWKKFKRKYKKRRRAYIKTFNQDLRADLDELYARDQYFRQAPGGLRVHGDTIRKIEEANLQQLLGWVKEYGYPSEDQIGLADTLEQLPRYTVVIQRQTKARRGYDFYPVLKEAVHKGRISPQAAAFLLDQQEGKSKYGSKALLKVSCDNCSEDKQLKHLGEYMVEKKSRSEKKQTAAAREALGLEPLEDYQKKVFYNLQDRRFKLAYSWSVVNYQVPSKEAAEVLMERLQVAE